MSGICPCTLGNSVAGALFNLKNAKKLNQDQDLPEQTASATVLSRRVDTLYSLTRSDSSWIYLVKFRLETGEETELMTTEEAYGILKENAKFSLTWQGSNLIRFTAE